jgi:homoserine dehydrogenase
MINIAILGFGVVGGGVAELITQNNAQVESLGGDKINIKHILDLRDFPDSPFSDRVTHDFSVIVNDPDVDCVIEVMGGSHPAYEYTIAALSAGKHVISSNKEVVANFGDEFLALAEKMGVCYKFEAAVGGGIPVIAPLISFVTHNKINEVRGILNGTTNYILTKMFSFGADFDESLADAQEKGYAERNPDADILGTDAARKITILTSLITGGLADVNAVHTEGITKIRKADVQNAEKLRMKIKLLGRCILGDDGAQVMVAPFMIPEDEPLAGVSGVFNAVEVLGDPINRIMFYGPGAGAGPTASAVVGDLMQVMRSGTQIKAPTMKKGYSPLDFQSFRCRSYIAAEGVSEDVISSVFGGVQIISENGEIAFVTGEMCEAECEERLDAIITNGGCIKSRIRLL